MGVIERSSGKQIPTERARRSDKIKICFTVAKNTIAESGDNVVNTKFFYDSGAPKEFTCTSIQQSPLGD